MNIWEAAALLVPSSLGASHPPQSLEPGGRTGYLFDHPQHSEDRVYLTLQDWKASNNGYSLALQKKASEILYKIEISQEQISGRNYIIHRHRVMGYRALTAVWGHQLLTCSLVILAPPQIAGHRAGCAHARLPSWKNIPKLHSQRFCNPLYKPTPRKVFLTTAVKTSSPDGAWVLHPTAWQQVLSSTLHTSRTHLYGFLNIHQLEVTQLSNVQKPSLFHSFRTRSEVILTSHGWALRFHSASIFT